MPGPDEHNLESAVPAVLARHLEPRRYRPEQVLFRMGERTGNLVVLDRGRVKAVRVQPDGASVLLYVFGPGDVFGFLPFLDGGPYPASAIAIDEVRARVMTRPALRRLVREEPEVTLALLEALGRRLREAFDRLGAQAAHDATTQVAAAILLLLPADVEEGSLGVVEIPSPTYGFAADVGLTAETFSRAVTRLVEADVLHRIGRGRLQILDLERLRQRAASAAL